MADAGRLRADLVTLGGTGLQNSNDPLKVFARQPMKHREVSAEEVSLRGKMRVSKAIEDLKVCLRDPGGEDKRFACLQGKILSMLGKVLREGRLPRSPPNIRRKRDGQVRLQQALLLPWLGGSGRLEFTAPLQLDLGAEADVAIFIAKKFGELLCTKAIPSFPAIRPGGHAR